MVEPSNPVPVPTAAGDLPAVPGYEVLRILGKGANAVVYLARQVGLDRLVALKVILSDELQGPQARERFLREARLLGRLEHPHILRIHEVGEHAGWPFLSLEFASEGSLADRVGQPWPAQEAAQLVRQLASAVQAAHERGVVHRDLKPANVLIAADGTPKIGDFGLARDLHDPLGRTESGAVLGTPCYMAPEQARGESRRVGLACDVHALGAILYELLAGRPPFAGASMLDVLLQVAETVPEPPSQHCRDVPADLDAVCRKCLEKDPSRRYTSAADLADDLGRFLEGLPVRAGQRRAPRRILATLGACLLGAAMLTVLLWPGGTPDGEREEPEAATPAKGEVPVRQEKPEFVAPDEERRFAAAGEARSCAFDAGGKALSWIAEDHKVTFRFLDGDRTVTRVIKSPRRLTRLALAPGGTLAIVLNSAGGVSLVSAGPPRPPVNLRGLSNARAIGFSPDGRLLAVARIDEVLVWHVQSGARVDRFPTPTVPVHLRFTPEGLGLVVATARDFAILSLNRDVSDVLVKESRGTGIALSPCGGVLAVGMPGGEVVLHELNPQEELARIACATRPVQPLAFSPEGRLLLTLREDGVLILHDAITGRVRGLLGRAKDSILSAAFPSSGGKVVAATKDGWLSTWSLKDLATRQTQLLSDARREQAWGDLATAGAVGATALSRLLDDSGPVLAFVQNRLCPPGIDSELYRKIHSAMRDLDSDDRATRVAASATLAKIGPAAQAALEGAVRNPPSEEVRQRAQALLARLETHWPEDRRRWRRVFRLLELKASDGAALLLRDLDSPQRPGWVRLRARQALGRLLRRGVVRPPWVE
jgi:tRNA A-37 threonylcarbamoyl transferase component Bud32